MDTVSIDRIARYSQAEDTLFLHIGSRDGDESLDREAHGRHLTLRRDPDDGAIRGIEIHRFSLFARLPGTRGGEENGRDI